MTTHHDGDGCAGGIRDLAEHEPGEIGQHVAAMLLDIARRDYHSCIAGGRFIGIHYGARGEFLLAIQLATQITGMANPDHCDAQGLPLVKEALPVLGDRLTGMMHTLASCFDQTREATDADLTAAVDDSAPRVETFLHAVAAKDKAAMRVWADMYAPEDTGDRDRANLLRAAAVSSLLTVWASRYSVLGHPAVG